MSVRAVATPRRKPPDNVRVGLEVSLTREARGLLEDLAHAHGASLSGVVEMLVRNAHVALGLYDVDVRLGSQAWTHRACTLRSALQIVQVAETQGAKVTAIRRRARA